MFDLGFAELLVIGIVALIVVGPKDLPMLFRSVGRFVGKAKGMAREFSAAMNQAADQAGVKDVTESLRSATDGLNKVSNPFKTATDAIKDTAKSVTDLNIDPDSETGKLAAKRAEDAKKVQDTMAKKAQERQAPEAAETKKTATEAPMQAGSARQANEPGEEQK